MDSNTPQIISSGRDELNLPKAFPNESIVFCFHWSSILSTFPISVIHAGLKHFLFHAEEGLGCGGGGTMTRVLWPRMAAISRVEAPRWASWEAAVWRREWKQTSLRFSFGGCLSRRLGCRRAWRRRGWRRRRSWGTRRWEYCRLRVARTMGI